LCHGIKLAQVFDDRVKIALSFNNKSLATNKKRRPKDRLSQNSDNQQLGAGWCIVVITSGNNDTSDHSSRSEYGNDNAATTTKLAFFLLDRSTLCWGFRSG
jgi:hypothetical protein